VGINQINAQLDYLTDFPEFKSTDAGLYIYFTGILEHSQKGLLIKIGKSTKLKNCQYQHHGGHPAGVLTIGNKKLDDWK
jgi:hypothetical protein